MRVSVIVATAGVSRELERVLARARDEARANQGELVLAWNAAGDAARRELPERIAALADRVVDVPTPGKSGALNAALAAARGEICAFLDDDGAPDPGWLAALLEAFDDRSSALPVAGVGGRVVPVYEDSGPTWYQALVRDRRCYFLGPSHDLGERRVDYPPQRVSTVPIGANCAYRRELALKFPYSPELGPNRSTGTRGGEDTLLALQVQREGWRLVYEPRAVVRHPVVAERMTQEFVERGYYWQGVEGVRLRRLLGGRLRAYDAWKAWTRILHYRALLALSPIVPLSQRLHWRRRVARQRGKLDELQHKVGLAFALLGALCLGSCDSHAGPPRPNVILVVVDTLRADRLGCYGYARATSPNLDRFAAECVRFESAYSPAPRTVAAHASLFTSTYPSVHGVWNEPGPFDERQEFQVLSPRADCLAEVLESEGYATAAFADGGWLQKSRGLAQGFEKFSTRFAGAADRVDASLEWLEQRKRQKPFFLFLHTYEVHTPYLPPPELLEDLEPDYAGPLRGALAEARAYHASGQAKNAIVDVHRRFFEPLLPTLDDADRRFLSALYDAEVRSADRELGRFFERLRADGLLDRSIVIVTSDHGEEFGEHGKYEHLQVFDECLRVPLLVRLPDGPRGAVRADPAELVDVMPSLLAELGIAAPEAVQGRELAWRTEPTSAEERDLWSAINAPEPQVAWRRGALKVVWRGSKTARPEHSTPVAFDLSGDPGERAPLAPERVPAGLFERALGAWNERQAEAAERRARLRLEPTGKVKADFTEEQQNELKQLGYF